MSKRIRLGTRPSLLALRQAEEIKRSLQHFPFDVISIETEGDRDKTTPLAERESSDFFTYDIEKALLDGRIDAAIHSAKDIEEKIPKGLCIVALTRSISPHECLVSKEDLKLNELPPGAIVGTSSKKRKAAITNFRSDLTVKDIRGNIEERLAQLDRGGFDAIIVAHAASLRLGYQDRITEIIPRHIIEPHPLQGRLAVQVRCDRQDMIEIFRRIDEK
jgi:hydroxymethylbilane synthase